MKYSKEEIKKNIIAVILFIAFFIAIFYMCYPVMGNVSKRDSFIFISLFIVVILFSLVARWIIDESGNFLGGPVERDSLDNEGNPKEQNENMQFAINIIKTSFHLLPLYFTLFLIKIDLMIGFKCILFVLSIFSYMLVEMTNIWNQVINFSAYVLKKTKSRFISTITIIFVPIIIVISTLFFVYSMLMFYIKRFS